MRNTLVVDTSVVYAALDRTDDAHVACVALLSSGPAVSLSAPVIVETALLAGRRGHTDAVLSLLDSVIDESVLVVQPDIEDYARMRDLIDTYADLPLDIVDASVVAIAERLEQDTIATLDRRHFSVVRPSHVPAFTLVPELS